MKRYIKAYRETTEEYRGYFIDHYVDGDVEEFVVDVDLAGEGDEHSFSTYSDAKDFIDDLYLMENVNKKLGY